MNGWDIELRKLPPGPLCRIADILETNNDWKKVMSLITKNPLDDNSEPKYNNEHMRLIEDHAKTTNKKCAEILFDEWGTSGRVRPTLKTLNDIIIKASIYRAADEISLILNEPPPTRPSDGPAANIDTNITNLLNELTMDQTQNGFDSHTNPYDKNFAINNDTTAQMKSTTDNIPVVVKSYGNETTAQVKSATDLIQFSVSMVIPDLNALRPNSSTYSTSEANIPISVTPHSKEVSRVDPSILKNTSLTHFEYRFLEAITNTFSNDHFNGRYGKIGSGGFGDVYVGFHQQFGFLAIKKLRQNLILEHKPDMAVKVFNSEVKCLAQLRHENIVPIIGYSADGPSLCVICEYISGGSLEQNLEAKILNEAQRLAIMIGTAEGLKYIHQSEKPIDTDGVMPISDKNSTKKNNFLHGDVKSANILLTKDGVPKLCDFGVAKHIDTTFTMTSLMGTSAYMAPEGFTGTVTQKIDIYSYGIVLLELLTGLKPIVVDASEQINIKDYIEENVTNGDITKLLDPVVGIWTKADPVYELVKQCLQKHRRDRPTINVVCDILHEIVNS